jgi:hypothetical protein
MTEVSSLSLPDCENSPLYSCWLKARETKVPALPVSLPPALPAAQPVIPVIPVLPAALPAAQPADEDEEEEEDEGEDEEEDVVDDEKKITALPSVPVPVTATAPVTAAAIVENKKKAQDKLNELLKKSKLSWWNLLNISKKASFYFNVNKEIDKILKLDPELDKDSIREQLGLSTEPEYVLKKYLKYKAKYLSKKYNKN